METSERYAMHARDAAIEDDFESFEAEASALYEAIDRLVQQAVDEERGKWRVRSDPPDGLFKSLAFILAGEPAKMTAYIEVYELKLRVQAEILLTFERSAGRLDNGQDSRTPGAGQ